MWEEHFFKKYKKLHQGGLFLFFGLGIGKLNYNIFLFFWKNVRNFLRVIFFSFSGLGLESVSGGTYIHYLC